MALIPKSPIEILEALGVYAEYHAWLDKFYIEYKWRDIIIADQIWGSECDGIEFLMKFIEKLRKDINFYLDAIWG